MRATMVRRATTGCAAIAVVYFAFAHTAAGQRFDDAAKLFAVTNEWHYRRLETLASLVAAGSAVLVIGAIWAWARDRVLPALVWAAVAVVPPWVLAEIGKVTLPRPHLHATPTWIGSASFPSGHVTFTAGCLLAMLTITPSRYRLQATAVAVIALGTSVTLVTQSGMHRVSDVLAAPILAFSWVVCLAARQARDGEPAHRISAAVRRVLTGAGALAVIGFAIGSPSLRSEAGGAQHIPAQTVINHTSYGAVIVAYAIVIAVGAIAFDLLGPVNLLRDDRSAMSIDTVRTPAV